MVPIPQSRALGRSHVASPAGDGDAAAKRSRGCVVVPRASPEPRCMLTTPGALWHTRRGTPSSGDPRTVETRCLSSGRRPAMQRWLTSWSCRTADRIVVTAGIIDAALRLASRPLAASAASTSNATVRGSTPPDCGIGPGPGWRARILSPRYHVDEPQDNLDIVIDAFVAVRKRF
jgi:hypothetical protein